MVGEDLQHGQAVRKAVFGRVFRLPERRSLMCLKQMARDMKLPAEEEEEGGLC